MKSKEIFAFNLRFLIILTSVLRYLLFYTLLCTASPPLCYNTQYYNIQHKPYAGKLRACLLLYLIIR